MNSPVKRADTTLLDRTSWLKAAAVAIADEGFNGTRVLPLSKRLGVTRGSFYWHFEDHAAFVRAFLEHWRDQQLHAVNAYQHASGDAVTVYRQLLDDILKDSAKELKRLKVEFALREYARTDAFAASVTAEVDAARINFFMPVVREISDSVEEATSFARFLLVQVSGAQLAIVGPNCNSAMVADLKRTMLKSLEAMRDSACELQPANKSPKRAR
jgi:AcrR family transcriptional regulator